MGAHFTLITNLQGCVLPGPHEAAQTPCALTPVALVSSPVSFDLLALTHPTDLHSHVWRSRVLSHREAFVSAVSSLCLECSFPDLLHRTHSHVYPKWYPFRKFSCSRSFLQVNLGPITLSDPEVVFIPLWFAWLEAVSSTGL